MAEYRMNEIESRIGQLSVEINDLRYLLEMSEDSAECERLRASINELVLVKIALFERIHNKRLNDE